MNPDPFQPSDEDAAALGNLVRQKRKGKPHFEVVKEPQPPHDYWADLEYAWWQVQRGYDVLTHYQRLVIIACLILFGCMVLYNGWRLIQLWSKPHVVQHLPGERLLAYTGDYWHSGYQLQIIDDTTPLYGQRVRVYMVRRCAGTSETLCYVVITETGHIVTLHQEALMPVQYIQITQTTSAHIAVSAAPPVPTSPLDQ